MGQKEKDFRDIIISDEKGLLWDDTGEPVDTKLAYDIRLHNLGVFVAATLTNRIAGKVRPDKLVRLASHASVDDGKSWNIPRSAQLRVNQVASNVLKYLEVLEGNSSKDLTAVLLLLQKLFRIIQLGSKIDYDLQYLIDCFKYC